MQTLFTVYIIYIFTIPVSRDSAMEHVHLLIPVSIVNAALLHSLDSFHSSRSYFFKSLLPMLV